MQKSTNLLLLAGTLSILGLTVVAATGIYKWDDYSEKSACVNLGRFLSKDEGALHIKKDYLIKTVTWSDETEWVTESHREYHPFVTFSEVMAGITVKECENRTPHSIPKEFNVMMPDGTKVRGVPIGITREEFGKKIDMRLNEKTE